MMKTWFSQLKIPIVTNKCPFCGNDIPLKSFVITQIEGKNISTCPNCSELIRRCPTCSYAEKCGFVDDKSEPQMIQRTIRQNGMVMSIPMKNPHLIEKHCCHCRCNVEPNPDMVECQREKDDGFHCPNYKIEPTLLQVGFPI